MTDTVRERIMAATATALNGAGKPAGLTVQRFPVRPSTALPVAVILPEQEDVSRAGGRAGPLERRELTLRVELRKNPGSSSPDTALDPLVAWVTTALQADPSLGGLANGVQELGTTWEVEPAGDGYVALASVRLRVDYQTTNAAQTARS